MPLFMMISGFFSSNSYIINYKSLVQKKGRELILPVLTWGLIFYIGSVFIKLSNGEPLFPYWDLRAILTKNLWFLKSVFLCYILAYICFKNNQTNYLFLLLTFCISLFVTSHNMCIMYPAFIIGYYLNRNNQLIFSKKLMLISFVLFIILLIPWDSSFWPIPDLVEILISTGSASIGSDLFKLFYRIAIGTCGSLFFITLFSILLSQRNNNFITKIAEYGKYTLGIYIFQFFILETILGKYIKLDQLNSLLFHFVVTPIISITLLILFASIVKYAYSNAPFPLLLWGKKRTTDILNY